MNYLTPISQKAVVSNWSKIQPFIEMALEHNCESLQPIDVLQNLTTGQWHLLAATDDAGELQAVLVTEVVSYHRIRALNLLLLAGSDSSDWDATLDAMVMRWAQHCKADRIESLCRPGLAKVLKKSWGYSQAYVMMVKPVDPLH